MLIALGSMGPGLALFLLGLEDYEGGAIYEMAFIFSQCQVFRMIHIVLQIKLYFIQYLLLETVFHPTMMFSFVF